MREFDLRKLQLVELEMLKDVAKFCDDNNIKYWLDSGTLLGAVRHGGFIPWDDDIDISMNYTNYIKFLKLAPQGLPEKYFVQNYRTDPKVAIRWSRVRINQTTSMEPQMAGYDIHYGICMDVFLRTGIPKNRIHRKMQNMSLGIMSILLEKHYSEFAYDRVPTKLKILYNYLPEKIRLLLINLFEHIAIIDEEKCEQCFNVWNSYSSDAKKYSSAIYDINDMTKIKFEDSEFWAPRKSKEYLVTAYGEWEKIPPENERGGHGDIIIDFDNSYEIYFDQKK